MSLIDTHCHLHDQEFFTAEQAEEMLKHAHEKDVDRIICIGTSHEDSLVARDFASSHNNVYWTYGIHPENAATTSEQLISDADKLVKRALDLSSPLVAIGEVGLDYHYPDYQRETQIRLLEQMLELATRYDLPVSFHIREAFDDFFPVVANYPKLRGVVHSFTDSKKVLKRILNETEFYIGVNGLATYSTLPTPPLERILLETDAPFLTPKPFRGIINEPAYVSEVAKWLAATLGLEFKIIEKETTENGNRLFNLCSTLLCKKRGL